MARDRVTGFHPYEMLWELFPIQWKPNENGLMAFILIPNSKFSSFYHNLMQQFNDVAILWNCDMRLGTEREVVSFHKTKL
jgi:hypothetical protein